MLIAFLLGVSLTAHLFVLSAVGYSLWRYCFKPWQTQRRDTLALKAEVDNLRQELKELKSEQGLRKASYFSDAQLAAIEKEQRMETLRRAVNTA